MNGYTFRESNFSSLIVSSLFNWAQLLKERVCLFKSLSDFARATSMSSREANKLSEVEKW